MKIRIHSIIGSSIGNILEWYDFGLFAIFSPYFAELFFPAGDNRLNRLAVFGIFAAGFLCRPIGALIFGWLGDKKGRASTLKLSILMIALPTLLIAFLPGYKTAGLLAPILLTVIRLWQGISLGGEYSGNLIYLAESAPNHLRATITSLAGTGANLGFLLATLVATLCTVIFSETALKQFGWRLPYLVSGILSLIVYFIRLNMQETAIFQHLREKKQLPINPLRTIFTRDIFHMFRTFGLVCLGSTFYYFSFIWLPVFIKSLKHFSLSEVSEIFSSLLVMMLVLVPLAGKLCDTIGRRKLLLFNALTVAVAIIPGLYLIQHGSFVLLLFVLLLLTILSCLEQATTSIAVVENFPLPARYTGLSFSYNLGNGILGGTAPFICDWLSRHFSLAPACYIVFCALITATVVWFFVPETRYLTLEEA